MSTKSIIMAVVAATFGGVTVHSAAPIGAANWKSESGTNSVLNGVAKIKGLESRGSATGTNYLAAATNTIVGVVEFRSDTNHTLWVTLTAPTTNGLAIIQSHASGDTPPQPIVFTNAPIMLPRFTRAQRDALTPINDMIIMQSDDTAGPRVYVGGAWYKLNLTADP